MNTPVPQSPAPPGISPVRPRPSWWLPVLVTVAAFLAYLPSLSSRASLWSTELAIRACGWEWRPILQQPLWYLFQWPFHLLPLEWRPLALNLGNLFLASVALGLLARAVQMWPTDRTPDLRDWNGERLGWLSPGGLIWLPPVLAAASLGLTLNFWRQATSATGDMIDLAVLAFIVVLFVEYQREPRARWLWMLSFAYGVGMTNDWAFTALLPIFLIAVIGLLGWGATLTQLALIIEPFTRSKEEVAPMLPHTTGLLDLRPPWILLTGLLLGWLAVLPLPVAHWLTAHDQLSLGQCLLTVWYWQKAGVLSIQGLVSQDGLAAVLALSSLVPLWLVSVRWQDEETSYFTVSYWFTGKSFWLLHSLLAVISGWVLLGAIISPANVLLEQSFLPHYFICALVLGCCLNYLVRRALGRAVADRSGPWTTARRLRRVAFLTALAALLTGMLSLMFVRNAPVIRLVNRTLPADFERWVLAALPPGPKVVVADDSNVLNLARLLLLRLPGGRETVFLDSSVARRVDYLRQQSQLYPPVWQTAFANLTNAQAVRPVVLDRLVEDLATQRPVCYLHPSEMYPYDHFVMRDRGFVHQLVRRGTNDPVPILQPDSPQWEEFERDLFPHLTNAIENLGPSLRNVKISSKLQRLFFLPPPRDFTLAFFARYFSLAANAHGVLLQRAGRWTEADAEFVRALALNPYNASARANRDYNFRHTHPELNLTPGDPGEEGFGNFDSIEQAIKACGAVDDPAFRTVIADSCAQAELYHQAADQYQRVIQLEPQNLGYQFLLANLELEAGRPEVAVDWARRIRRELAGRSDADQVEGNLVWLETRARLAAHQKSEALTILSQAVEAARGDGRRMADAVAVLWRSGLRAEARDLMDQLAAQHPDNPAVFILRGYVHLELEEPAQAERDFARALELNPRNELARYQHGCVLIRLHQLDAATVELQTMLQQTNAAFPAHFALAQIARARQNSSLARSELEAYLRQAVPADPDYTNALQQLNQLP